MIISNSFCRSEKARSSEFSTNNQDTPLITQFASNNNVDILHGSQMVYNYCDGVDINCGCPQRWAMQDGYGSYLLKKPELIEDMIKTVRRNLPSNFSVSLKIRLLNKNLKDTLDFCRKMESLGPTFITIHGRTPAEKTSVAVDIEAVGEIKKSLSIPVIFNGDIQGLADAERTFEVTNCDGFMAARASLSNPALFQGLTKTPMSCVQDWLNISEAQNDNQSFQNFHHHLTFMMEKMLTKPEKVEFNDYTNKQQCLNFLEEKFQIRPQIIEYPENINCIFDETSYKRVTNSIELQDQYSSDNSLGKFFLTKLQKTVKVEADDDYLGFMNDGNIFGE